MPRYECVEGSSRKFWEIERSGNTFTVRYGKIGTDGQSSTKVFDSDDKATKEYDKLVASKVKKGYELVADVQRAADPGSNPALEAAILANPDDTEAWQVYADWLQSNDDPRGALIAAFASGADTAALIAANEKAFMGRFAEGGDLAPYTEIEWGMGFWRTAKAYCDFDSAEEMPESVKTIASVLGHLLRHPSAKFLSSLSIGLTEGVTDGEAEWQACIDTIIKNGVRPSIRSLYVGEYEFPDETEISWTQIGDHEGIWTVLPNLVHFRAQGGGIHLGPLDAPRLETMALITGGLPTEPVQRIAAASLPSLERLELWFGAEDYGAECSAPDIEALLANTAGLPALRWLGLMNCEFANELPMLVADSPMLPQLEELDLSMGTMTDEGGQVLLARADQFRHLKSIHLDRNYIGSDLAARITAALPQTVFGRQQSPNDYVYVSVGE